MLWLLFAIIAVNGLEGRLKISSPETMFQESEIVKQIGSTVEQWDIVERADPTQFVKLSFRFASDEKSMNELERRFWATSTPGTDEYGKFATTTELQSLLQPTATSVQSVVAWVLSTLQISELALERMSKWSPFGDVLYLNLAIKDVESLLDTECYLFVHRLSAMPAQTQSTLSFNQRVPVTAASYKTAMTPDGLQFAVKTVASPDYVPELIREHIKSIGGVHRFPQLSSISPRSAPFRIHAFYPQSHPPTPISPMFSADSSQFQLYIPSHNSNLLTLAEAHTSASAPERPLPREVEGYAGDGMAQLILQPYCPDDSSPTLIGNVLFCGEYGLTAITVAYTKTGSSVTSQIAATGLQIEFTIDNYTPYTCTITTTWTTSAGDSKHRSVSTLGDLIGSRMNSPAFVHNWYNFPDGLVAVNSSSTQGVVGLDLSDTSQGCFSSSDATSFYSFFGINNNVNLITTYGWTSANCPSDSETQLDIQWITGMAPQVNTQLWHDNTQQQGTDFAEIFDNIIATSNRPSVLSISYGALESAYVDNNGADDMSLKFRQLGALGVSVIVASGDSGPYYSNDNSDCGRGFRPTFPASNPYVTSVGATMLAITPNSNGNIIEIVCSTDHGALITSGGGFSQHWPMPPYQNFTTPRYVKNQNSNATDGCVLPPSVLFDSTKRAYPDLSLLGHSYIVMSSGSEGLMDGTSASAPAFASFISMYNDARLSRGLPVLGFLNPLLYQVAEQDPSSFFDVTEGGTSCMTRDQCCTHGFSACRGFDAATGLGTPRFDKLGLHLVPGGIAGPSATPCFSSDCDVPNHTSMSTFELIVIIGSSVVGGLVVCSVTWRLCKCCFGKLQDSKPAMSINNPRSSGMSKTNARLDQDRTQTKRMQQEALLSEQEQLNIAIAESLAPDHVVAMPVESNSANAPTDSNTSKQKGPKSAKPKDIHTKEARRYHPINE